jgi:hypothetical protein
MNAVPDDEPPTSLKALYVLAWRRRTTLFGYTVTALGICAASDLFSPLAVKIMLLASGLIGAALGHLNASLLSKQESPK